jgi:AhpD family alkylhydroperoxidase
VATVKQVMAPGALDPVMKEMIYVAVSVTNNCEYCIHSHVASARTQGMTPQMLDELIAITALANATNASRMVIAWMSTSDSSS